MKLLSEIRSFDGWFKRCQHQSTTLNCEMVFTVYLPPQAETQKVPVLYWLSGLTCTDENFVIKAGAQRVASELGLAIVVCDTSPRGDDVHDIPDDWNIGKGAGFYLNATQAPWDKHYHMYDYVVDELPALVNEHFPVTDKCSISGHSMGGHGALTIALKNPGKYKSVSAFAPICNPTASEKGPWRFTNYLGEDESTWAEYDACLLIPDAKERLPLLVDQGTADSMIDGLQPENLKAACEKAGHPLTLRMHEGYDHAYFFVSTFIEDHLRFHAEALA